MKTSVAVLFLIASLDYISTSNFSSPGTFTVVCPNTLLSGREIKCIATAEDLSGNGPLKLDVTVGDSKGAFNITKNISLDANTAQLLKFSTENFPNGDYILSVTGGDNFEFAGEAKLGYLVKNFSVFIQTDKALYKADDLMRFRLFAVDANTLPYKVKASPVVSIFNPTNILVKKYSNVTFLKGRYEGEFQLASDPLVGDWKIRMESEGQVFEKTFTVDEYTLPAFAATLSVPSSIPITEGKLLVTVGAQYTFGQSVQGTAVVTFKRNGYQLAYQRTVAINASAVTFEVDFQTDLLMIEDFYDQFVTVTVDFTDSLTGQLATTSQDVKCLQYEYQLTASGSSTFSPGLQYTFGITAVHYDGKPAVIGSSINITTAFDDAAPVTQVLQIDDMSSAHLTVTVPLNTSVIHITSEYKDAILNTSVYAPSTHQDQFLMVDIATTYPFIYEPVDINFETTEEVSSINVVMLSKGLIVHTLRLPMIDFRASTQIMPKFSFAPETTIFAYYVRSNGEIVSGSATLTLKSRLPNYLTLALTTDKVQPGDVASLEVMSTMNSFVSLLAIDQRSLLLKSGNDLSLDAIFNDLSGYSEQSSGQGRIGGLELMPPWFFYRTYETDFSDCGLAIVSNAVNIIPVNPPMYEDAPVLVIPPPIPNKTPNLADSGSPRVRQNFAETFLWETVKIKQPNTRIPNRGMKTVEAVVPDSITSYLISGVSMNEKHGMAIATASPILTVFQPFFVQMSLPFSIKRGEVLRQEILVFNYLNQAQRVTLYIVKSDSEFKLNDMISDGWKINEKNYFLTFTIESGSVQKAVVHLETLVIGFIDLKVTAIGSLAGDAVKQTLRVVPEGIESFIVSSTIVQHNATSNYASSLSCNLPNNVVSDTVSISTTVVGSCMGKTLSNLDNLIQMPSGCGEQNMLNLVPDIEVLKYLKATNQLTDDVLTEATTFIEQGYQQELSYYRSDYSFSAFGNSDVNGSTWLTAFVLGAFNDAEEYIDVDQSIYYNSFGFLISKQDSIGCFVEDGNVIHKDMQGGAANGVALTAYVSIVLTKCLTKFPWLQTYRDQAITNIITYYNQSDVYSLAIVSYALGVAENENFDDVFNQLLSLAIQTPDKLHWEKEVEVSWYPQSLDVEITAYGLFCALKSGDISMAFRIVNWLVQQQNPTGGFQSTQDTVVGLSALAAFGAAFSMPTQNLTLSLTPQYGAAVIAGVNEHNLLTPQNFDLAPNVRRLDICSPVFGSGMAIVSLTCKFYVNDPSQPPRFKIEQDFVDSCAAYLKMKICLSSVPANDTWSPGMVLVTIKYPTGFIHDVNSPVCTAFSKLDTANGGTEAQAYINNVTEVPTCCYVNAIRAFEVEKLKGGSIEVVDYYDTSKKASLSYSLPALSDC